MGKNGKNGNIEIDAGQLIGAVLLICMFALVLNVINKEYSISDYSKCLRACGGMETVTYNLDYIAKNAPYNFDLANVKAVEKECIAQCIYVRR